MEFESSRRRFLELTGTGTALSLAGCNALQANQTNTETTTEGTSNGQATVAIAVEADQQKLQQRQQEISSQLKAGNISRTEAQQQFRKMQRELRAKAIAAFSERASSNTALTIENTVDQFGILRVSGKATALIETLSVAEVSALLPAATFQQAKAQARQQTKTTTSTS